MPITVAARMLNRTRARCRLFNSTVSGNSAHYNGGGVFANLSNVILIDSTVSANYARFNGGGVEDVGGTVTAINSTMSGNQSAYSGGVHAVSASVTLTNSTVSNNSATVAGGGGGGGSAILLGSKLTLTNTILSGNTAGLASQPDLYANQSSVGATNSLLGTALSISLSLVGSALNASNANSSGNNIFSDSPGLDPLGNNGGPTPTMALELGSPALDMGSPDLALDPSTGFALSYDQRVSGFPRRLSGLVDIGAYQHRSRRDRFLPTASIQARRPRSRWRKVATRRAGNVKRGQSLRYPHVFHATTPI